MRRSAIVTTRNCKYIVLFEPVEDGGYAVTCPSLPGLVTEGETLEETREMAAEAIRGYLETLSEDGLPVPPEIAEVLEVTIDER
jgi:antitoxin HicB